MGEQREQWSSKIGFILASAGAAIGLGAIWKFPYVTGTNGGGAFFLLFIAFTLLIGLPMLISEFVIGRGSKKEAVSAYQKLAPKSGWTWIGKFGLVGCFLLLSFYSVVGGWVLTYAILATSGQIIGPTADYGALFGSITGTPWIGLVGLAIFLVINVLVLSLGIRNGIEKANKFLMPLLFVFFLILVARSLTLEGASEGIRFFLQPDFYSITSEGVLYALGQSFFALAVGFSCLVTYSSYLDKKESIPTAAVSVVGMNLFVSLLAGLAIFPAIFALGFEPTEGPGLLFIVLPAVFAEMVLGELFLALFLLLFLFATLTSSFSLLEIIVSAFTESKKRTRKRVAAYSGLVIFLAGIPAALSFGALSNVQFFNLSIFDATDFLVSNIMLPLGCLLISLFISLRMEKRLMEQEILSGNRLTNRFFTVWLFLMKYVVPLVIIIVFINTLGIL
ncbi:sodium-dependent transporter [Alkalihalophilus lindianensis]|uniref:Transporter n=1 Tax=Alkalihalophilus lindianensis TaxID=1630542 RepID=A0ABU3XD20_9BACI|nr:sodium-dependent transporter [Alkalihalophilus lindianensis]MDV2685770.1 sodium-dependent transporter [Alkalihalophilus lindianensis]